MTFDPPRARIVVPLAVLGIAVVWVVGVGFRLDWWHTGNLDLAWNRWAADAAGPVGRAIAQALAVVGTGVPALISALVVACLVAMRRGRRWGAVALAISGLSELDVILLKGVAGRLRPESVFGLHTSFPSGHTTNAAVLACLVAVLLLEGRARVVPLAYPVLMGWSRTVLHAHWLSDVVAGCVLGGATVLLCTTVAAHVLRRVGTRPRTWNESQRQVLDGTSGSARK